MVGGRGIKMLGGGGGVVVQTFFMLYVGGGAVEMIGSQERWGGANLFIS